MSKVYIAWAKKSTDELSFMTLKGDAKFEGKLTSGLKKDMRICQIFTRALEIVKIGTLIKILLSKVENV